MTDLRKAAQQALEAMGTVCADLICDVSHHAKKNQHNFGGPCPLQQKWHMAFQALRAALAEQLTDEQISDLWHQSGEQPFKFARMLLK